MGEIYVKYSPLGNNELEKFLASQDCEVNLPGLMGFVQYCAYNMAETVRLYGGSLVEKTAAEAALTLIAGMEKVIIKTLKDAGYHAPMPFSELIKLPEQSHTIGMGCKMGEGWLLTAEMLELVRSGYENIVCAQPFGCLPNHICGKGMIGSEKVVLVKPQTFMNLSGESIAEAVNFYKVDPASELLVIFDDISLAPGRIRIRKKGSAGGHNGIKNIIAQVGTEQFARIKVGVGEKPQGWDLADHVLGHMDKADRKLAEEAFLDAVSAVELIVDGKIEQAMNDYN